MLTDLIRLFYPNCCISCNTALVSGEEILCIKCLDSIPKSIGFKQQNKLIYLINSHRVLYFISLFEFGKNQLVQKLIHDLKYKNEKKLGKFFGKELYKELLSKKITESIDFIVPVPITKKKKKLRGYNQTEIICKTLGSAVEKDVLNNLLCRIGETQSQTSKSVYDRWQSVENSFQLTDNLINKDKFKGKHYLIVDDVVTTGATLEACAKQILKIEDSMISFAAIATA